VSVLVLARRLFAIGMPGFGPLKPRLRARGRLQHGRLKHGRPKRGRATVLPAFMAACLLTSCAGPRLITYTLTLPPATTPDTLLVRKPIVISVSAINVPNDVDGTDIIVRDGSVLQRSRTGRWASRLSDGVTSRLAERLAERYPQMLVTTTPVSDTPAVSIRINVSRLDIGADGTGVLEADWTTVPADPRQPERRRRVPLVQTVSSPPHADVVALVGQLIDALATDIDVGPLPRSPR
jgi:uncharacterized protein